MRRSENISESDSAVLMNLVSEFKKNDLYSYVNLRNSPGVHPKGGFDLHFDIKEEHKRQLIEFLYEHDFGACI